MTPSRKLTLCLATLALAAVSPRGSRAQVTQESNSCSPQPAAAPAPAPLTEEQKKANHDSDELRIHTDWASLSRYRNSDSALAPAKPGEKRVVFMGNSITEGWAPHFAEMFPGKPYVGRGISGQTTPQMLIRFRQDVIALAPAAVVILAGTNDIAGNTGPATMQMIEDNLASMTQLAKANGIRVVLASILPVYRYAWAPNLEPALEIVALNSWLKSYAAKEGEVYLDFESTMSDERHGLKCELTYDGVHPNVSGYRVMSRLTENAIAEALKGAH